MLRLSEGSVGVSSVHADAPSTMVAEIKLLSLLGIAIRCSSYDIVISSRGLASIVQNFNMVQIRDQVVVKWGSNRVK
jgi:hypothetical protein